MSSAFDQFWNAPSSYPITALLGRRAGSEDLAKFRADLDLRLAQGAGIEVADSIDCRGLSMLQEAKASRVGQLPESNFVRLVQIAVPETAADALFDYVYATARIGRPRGGMVMLSQPIHATPFRLPQGLPDEAD